MLPDRVSNPGPLTYESGALPIALRGPVKIVQKTMYSLIPVHQAMGRAWLAHMLKRPQVIKLTFAI